MTEYQDEPLVSRDVSIRREQNRQLKTNQQKEMENRRVTAPQSAWNQTLDATTDIYMRDALSKVRKSNVTIPDTLTRFHGTYIYRNK